MEMSRVEEIERILRELKRYRKKGEWWS